MVHGLSWLAVAGQDLQLQAPWLLQGAIPLHMEWVFAALITKKILGRA
jgi:hypothetical protein